MLTERVVNIVYPDPCRKVWLVPVKKTLHRVLDILHYVFEPTVVDPVASSVFGKWELLYTLLVNTII
jgi:hypothetical protein